MKMRPGARGTKIPAERFRQFLNATNCIGMNDDAAGFNSFQTLKPDDVVVVRNDGEYALVEVAESGPFAPDLLQWEDFKWIDNFRRVNVLDIGLNSQLNFQGHPFTQTFTGIGANKTETEKWYYKIKAAQMIKKLTDLLTSNYQVILTGAPGTGKTFLACELAANLLETSTDKLGNNERFGFVQFHPAYDYTDFVEGLKPEKDDKGQIGFALCDGIFRDFCKKARATEEKCVFVIDEINRADLSRVFGELFYALEPNYRGAEVLTQYSSLRDASERHFYVPKNVFIIGTMNDIDRSVMSMDFALRRRFAWYEVEADDARFDVVMHDVLTDKPDLKAKAKERYKKLNDRIGKEQELGAAYKIGPAYFRNLEKYKAENENNIWEIFWQRHLELLIREYVRGMLDEKDRVNKFKDAYLLNPEPSAQPDASVS